MVKWPYRVLLPRVHEKYECRLVTHSQPPFQFSCVCHLDCIPWLYTNGYASSGYGLLEYDDTEDGINYAETQKCYFCNKEK